MKDASLPPDVAILLEAVRRRLWAREFARAAHRAAWSWAALFAATALLHVWRGWPGLAAAGVAGAGVTAALAVLALARRPDIRRAAAFADRHLDGATAYSTLLESARDERDATAREARERLERWTGLRVARSRDLLQQSQRGTPDGPARPFWVALLATALAVVLVETTTPGSPSRAGTSSGPDEAMPVGDHSLLDLLEGPDAGDSAVADATFAEDGRSRDARVPAATASSPASAQEVEAVANSTAARLTGANPAATSTSPETSTTEMADAGSDSGHRSAAAGRAAGTTRDPRRPGAGTQAAAAAGVRWQATAEERGSPGARARAGQVTTYLAEAHAWQAPEAVRVPAAGPPAGARDAVPSPDDAAYVDAWRRRLEDSR
jgi:hypothetical protein